MRVKNLILHSYLYRAENPRPHWDVGHFDRAAHAARQSVLSKYVDKLHGYSWLLNIQDFVYNKISKSRFCL